MDLHRLINELKADVTLAQTAIHQHIVRFVSADDYAVARKRLRRSAFSERSPMRAVPIIHGFACTLKHPYKWNQQKSIIVEQNETARVQFIPGMLPSFAESPTHQHKGPFIPWGVARIQAQRIWKYSQGKNIRIGVIDTGVDFDHPDLSQSLGAGINFVQRWLPPFDDNGHGTHIAGTIAASNQRGGLFGVAPRATVYPIKAFDRKGTAYVSEIIQGLEWCIRHRMHIINMSFGMDGPSKALYEAVLNAQKAGIIIVASAGNDGAKDKIDFPARFKETIAIGAANKKGRIAKFSNRSHDINFFAPGEKIPSTWPRGQYRELSGSSMATAHVSGTIALMLSIRPKLRPKQIKSILIRSAKPLHYKQKSTKLRELNAYRAYQLMKRLFRKRKQPRHAKAARLAKRRPK